MLGGTSLIGMQLTGVLDSASFGAAGRRASTAFWLDLAAAVKMRG